MKPLFAIILLLLPSFASALDHYLFDSESWTDGIIPVIVLLLIFAWVAKKMDW